MKNDRFAKERKVGISKLRQLGKRKKEILSRAIVHVYTFV